jgi:hypothetical protein
VLHENIDCLRMLFVFLVDCERLFVKAMLSSNSSNFSGVVIVELVDIANNLAFISAYGSQQEEVLKILVLAERRGLDDNILQ